MVRSLLVWVLCFALLGLPACGQVAPPTLVLPSAEPISDLTSDLGPQRRQMVEQQIRRRGITDAAVLEAMGQVPRHRFVAPEFGWLAYSDRPLPIGYGQTISQPYMVAYMTEAADIAPTATVLEIGTGSGYQAAVLGEIAQAVYTLEIIPELANQASQTLKELGYTNIQVKTGDGYQGWPDHAPYDAIVVTAAPDHVPQPLIDQLAPHGKLVIPVGDRFQAMRVITKTETGCLEASPMPVQFVPMTGAAQE